MKTRTRTPTRIRTRTLTLTAFLAALAAGSALTLSAADQPASCPLKNDVAKQASHDKTAAACCAAKKDNACDKTAADCPKHDAAAKKTAFADAGAKTCPVSGEKLGSMGEPRAYTHKEAGKPDRTILLCCEMCVKSFVENPAKYLARLDAE
ncbi:MAG: hypothetical protein LBM04_12370 [Opitutaceae bacterium]|nr:hypothetical protein [Opitutaceae bacterium]